MTIWSVALRVGRQGLAYRGSENNYTKLGFLGAENNRSHSVQDVSYPAVSKQKCCHLGCEVDSFSLRFCRGLLYA